MKETIFRKSCLLHVPQEGDQDCLASLLGSCHVHLYKKNPHFSNYYSFPAGIPCLSVILNFSNSEGPLCHFSVGSLRDHCQELEHHKLERGKMVFMNVGTLMTGRDDRHLSAVQGWFPQFNLY